MQIERELMRGAGPLAVLKLLEGSEMYGYELVEALSKKTGGLLEMGQSTLYPMLYNLEAKGLVEARDALPLGPRRHRQFVDVEFGGPSVRMAVHHRRDLAHDFAVDDGDHEMMSGRREIVGELVAVDRLIEHLARDAIEESLVPGPDIADFDGHGLSIAH